MTSPSVPARRSWKKALVFVGIALAVGLLTLAAAVAKGFVEPTSYTQGHLHPMKSCIGKEVIVEGPACEEIVIVGGLAIPGDPVEQRARLVKWFGFVVNHEPEPEGTMPCGAELYADHTCYGVVLDR